MIFQASPLNNFLQMCSLYVMIGSKAHKLKKKKKNAACMKRPLANLCFSLQPVSFTLPFHVFLVPKHLHISVIFES